MNTIKQVRWQEELKTDNTVILKYDIRFPQMTQSTYRLGQEIFNQYNEQVAKRLQQRAQTTLFEEAKQLYQYNKEHGYPVMVYEVILTDTITYHDETIISLYSDQYEYTGGANGTTTRVAQNWNLPIGRQIPLYQLFPQDPYFLLAIFKQIQEQVQASPASYFENACCLAIQTFHPSQYYLTKEGIDVFFQVYDIAPHSSGIPVFSIRR